MRELAKQASPAQRLLRPALQKTCPHANASLTCPVFITGPEFLPELREQHRRTLTLIEQSARNGHARVAEMNQQVLASLDKIITQLGTTAGQEAADAPKTTCAPRSNSSASSTRLPPRRPFPRNGSGHPTLPCSAASKRRHPGSASSRLTTGICAMPWLAPSASSELPTSWADLPPGPSARLKAARVSAPWLHWLEQPR